MIPCALSVPLPWLGPGMPGRHGPAPAAGSVREALLRMAAPAWAAADLECAPLKTGVRVGRFEAPAWTCAVRVEKT